MRNWQTLKAAIPSSVSRLFAVLIICTLVLGPAEPVFAAFGDGTPTIPIASVFTGGGESDRVDGQTGAYSYRIPLEFPPGRNGLQPDVGLDYNSQNTSDGIVGYGWSLSIPYIQRLNKTGSENLYNASTTQYFTSSIDGELAAASTTSSSVASTTAPSIMDSLPLTLHYTSVDITSDSFTYTVPSGGNNKLFMFLLAKACDGAPTATLNGVSVTIGEITGTHNRACYYYGYLANPSSGTFQINYPSGQQPYYVTFTLKNAAQASPIDAKHVTNANPVTTKSTSTTTTTGYDLLLSYPNWEGTTFFSFGAEESEYLAAFTTPGGNRVAGSYKGAASTAGSESMTINISAARDVDEPVIAIKGASDPITSIGSTPTSYAARIHDGSSGSYSFSSNTWTVYDKKGTRYKYGSSDSGRMYDSSAATSSRTFKWMLQEIRDTNNNYISYTYNRDNNELYPYKITYTGNGSTDGITTLTFSTSTRPDIRQSYAPGFTASTTKRISQITAAINGTNVRRYDLGYGVGNNGYRSILTGVGQRGWNEANTLAALATSTFSYTNSSTQFYAPSNPGFEVDRQADVITDIDGNAINDVAVSYFNTLGATSSLTYVNQLSEINTITYSEVWGNQDGNGINPLERGSRLLDINGDGKSDIVRGYTHAPSGASSHAIFLNSYSTSTGYGFTASSTYTGSIPTFARTGTSYLLTNGIFGDVNGDGLPDFEQRATGVTTQAFLGNGSAWTATTTGFVPAREMPSTQFTADASQLIDVNGDGLDDWAYSDDSATYFLLNNGTGWEASPATNWTIGTSTTYHSPSTNTYYDRGIRYMDLNGDGLVDFVRAYKAPSNTVACASTDPTELADVKVVMLNTGSGWATSTAYTLPGYIVQAALDGGPPPCNFQGHFTYNEFGNWNGNGQQKQDVISTVNNSKGGRSTILYAGSAKHPDTSVNRFSPVSLLVATEVGANNGQGTIATTSYEYSGARMYLDQGVRFRKFSFQVATTTTSDTIVGTYYNQADGVDAPRGEQSDGYAHINRPFRKDMYDTSGNLKQRTFYRWDTNPLADTMFVGLGREVVWDYASNGTHQDRATDYLYSSSTNNLIKKTDFGEVTGNSDGTFTDSGTDKRTANVTYVASSTVNMSLPNQRTLLDNNSATTSDQKLYFDTLSFGQVSKGNNTKVEDLITGSTYASSTKTYDGTYGLVATSKDRNGNQTSFSYDSNNLYPITITNPLSQQTQFLYNYANGKPKKQTDANSSLTYNMFDGLGRLKEVSRSATTSPTTYATTTAFTYTDSTSTPIAIQRSDYLTSSNAVDTYQYFDGFERLLQERKESPTAGTYSVSDRQYYRSGLLASTSLPYFASGSAFTTPTATDSLYTGFLYDALQRVTRISNAVGATTNTYAKWLTTTTDPNGNIKDYTKDAFGNLTNVVERISSTLATTTYAYDSLNNLATTTDASGNVRGFTYDSLGRRLTAQDLHASGDGTFGTWSYTYDHAGNATTTTDAKGQVVNRTYDALNRMLTENYTGESGTEVTLTYDTCTNGKGYLCTASSTSAKTANIYDILGRVSSASTTVTGMPYTSSYVHDRQGNLATLTQPDNSQIVINYNLAGLPSSVQRKPSGGSFSNIVSSFTYAPTGQVISTIFGNSASSTRTYDIAAIYRLSQLKTTSQGTTLQNFAYTYDAVGNMTQIANTASTTAAITATYIYDTLNRLTSASALSASSTPYSQSFTYDALGNMLTSSLSLSSGGASTTAPSIMDTPVSLIKFPGDITSDTRPYTVPSGGTNKLFILMLAKACDGAPTATLNGVSLTIGEITGTHNRACYYYGYLANPSTGNFYLSLPSAQNPYYALFTLKNAAQASPIDAVNVTNEGNQSSNSTSVTTTVGYDLLLSFPNWETASFSSFGTGEIEYLAATTTAGGNKPAGSYKGAASTAGTETMTITISDARDVDEPVFAVKGATDTSTTTVSTYTYAGTNYVNPHGPTNITAGATSTNYTYDNNGNVIQTGSGATTTTYVYDYANRIISLGFKNSTTTFGYDAFGARVFQMGTTSTTTYPFKHYSIASTTIGSTKWATTTSYIFTGDSLLGTIDQQFANGVATSSAQTQYVHPDHLGSTHAITNAAGFLVQTLDYFPYGSTRINNATSTNQKRKYIGQFFDNNTNLEYLNARYYDPARGQFLSEDPSFLVLDPSLLSDPQQLNAYSYGRNNPISYRDTDGKKVELVTRPVMGVGVHAFILITNTSGNAAKLVGVPSNVQDPSRITLGGYAAGKGPLTIGTGNLYKGANKTDDYNLPESKYIERTQILAPSQYNGNQTAFENAILDSYNNIGSDLGAYSPFGVPITSQGNSNNTATSILVGAGVDRSVVQGYRPTSRYPVQTPGLGTPLPSNQRQSIADGLRGLVSTLTAIRDSLKSSSKNK